MHGADKDIVWLQRDFGIYVCNMFDTGQVSLENWLFNIDIICHATCHGSNHMIWLFFVQKSFFDGLMPLIHVGFQCLALYVFKMYWFVPHHEKHGETSFWSSSSFDFLSCNTDLF